MWVAFWKHKYFPVALSIVYHKQYIWDKISHGKIMIFPFFINDKRQGIIFLNHYFENISNMC